MKKYLFILTYFFYSLVIQAQVPNCAVIGMEHFGGNIDDQAILPGTVTWADGSFGFTVFTNSTSGNIKVNCGTQNEGGAFYRNYDANYTTLISQVCAKKGSYIIGPSFYIYPQMNGDTIIVGMTITDTTGTDISIERHSASGALIWNKNYGGTGNDGLVTVREAADGGFYILSGTNSTDGDVGLHYGSHFTPDMWLLRLDNNGDKVWATHMGGSGTDIFSDIVINPDGSSVVFGVTASSDYDCIGMKGGSDLYIIKLDSTGNKQWHKCLGGTGYDGSGTELGVWAKPDHHGGFYVLNCTDSQDGDVQQRLPDETDFWLLHVDSAANIIWENTYGGKANQQPTALCQSTDGTLWLAGWLTGLTTPSGLIDVTYGLNDGWVVHADTVGNLINQRVLGSNAADKVTTLYALPDGSVLATGNFNNGGTSNSSPFFPQTTQGWVDIFIAHLGPQTVGIDDREKTLNSWEAFPNPTSGHLKIRITGNKTDSYSLVISDMKGSVVHASSINKETTINTQKWASGNYSITLTDSIGNKDSKNITVQH